MCLVYNTAFGIAEPLHTACASAIVTVAVKHNIYVFILQVRDVNKLEKCTHWLNKLWESVKCDLVFFYLVPIEYFDL